MLLVGMNLLEQMECLVSVLLEVGIRILDFEGCRTCIVGGARYTGQISTAA
jgi:hypothetical protein